MSKEIIKPWWCKRCGMVYHDETGVFLSALKQGLPLICDVARAPETSPGQFYRCGGEIHPLAWP